MTRTHQELLRAALEDTSGAGLPPQHPSTPQSPPTPRSPSPAFHTQVIAISEPVAPSAAAVDPALVAPGRTVRWNPSIQDLPSLQPRTSAAEQFRRLRSRLMEYRGTQRLHTLLLSSALPQEGKSFVAANLAVGLNQHRGTRVLLIDGDMRRYSLQKYFGCDYRPGLADYLAGTAEPEEVMQRPDEETLAAFPGLAHLTLIPGGGTVEHIADLSEDSRFGQLIEHAKPFFDWIVVDSSPVTLVSDAVNLARHCDGVLLVVRAGVTDYQQAQKAQSELQATNLIGVVLNAVEDRPAPSYYGYGPVGADA